LSTLSGNEIVRRYINPRLFGDEKKMGMLVKSRQTCCIKRVVATGTGQIASVSRGVVCGITAVMWELSG
jgi:hypothetical protein